MMQTLQQQESFTIEGPQLEVLGTAESKLPAPARKKSNAVLVLVAAVLVAVVGIGGGKLRGYYSSVNKGFTAVSEHGYSISADLDKSADSAANMIRMSGSVLGENDTEVAAAQAALDAWNALENPTPAQQYAANTDLAAAVDALYQSVYGNAGEKDDAIATQHSQMTSQQDVIRREVQSYNEEAAAYNKTTQGFPANVLGTLWGAGKVEPFA